MTAQLTLPLALVLAAFCSALYAIFLQSERGRFIAEELTWVSVVIGVGICFLVSLLIIPLKWVAYFLGIFFCAAIPIIYRSLANYFDRCSDGDSPADKIVRKRIANNVIDSLEDTSALCRDAVQCHQKVMDRLTDLDVSDSELMMHLYEILSDVQAIWRKARAARNGEYV